MITAKVICDSIAVNNIRLTTIEATLPRIILAELRTHRQQSQEDEVSFYFCGMDEAGRELSMNSASSRAIPVEKMIEKVEKDPFVPFYWGKNQKGMQANTELSYQEQMRAKMEWLLARNKAVQQAKALVGMGVHKQIANRLLEPFLWHTVIVTATEWSNFFAQRCHPDAQPEMRMTAEAMKAAMDASEPVVLDYGQWHLPYVSLSELNEIDCWEKAKKISIARCARVSYLTHDGVRSFEKDLELYNRLTQGGHWSPFEHVATPMLDPLRWSGNFRGWFQARKEHANECR